MYNNSAKFRGFKSWTKRSLAFTLAEILITIIIIGIVAALTVPTTIQKYQRLYTETQLKVTYNLLSETIQRAEVDYGPRSTWNLSDYNTDKYKNINPTVEIITKYFEPYMRLKNSYTEPVTLSSIGYKDGFKFANGAESVNAQATSMVLLLQNGTFIFPYTDTRKNYARDDIPYAIYFNIDVNGPKKPNVFNKDIFRFVLAFSNEEPLLLGEVSEFNVAQYHSAKLTVGERRSIDELRRSCLSSAPKYETETCAAWIMMNNFKIPDGYPLL